MLPTLNSRQSSRAGLLGPLVFYSVPNRCAVCRRREGEAHRQWSSHQPAPPMDFSLEKLCSMHGECILLLGTMDGEHRASCWCGQRALGCPRSILHAFIKMQK